MNVSSKIQSFYDDEIFLNFFQYTLLSLVKKKIVLFCLLRAHFRYESVDIMSLTRSLVFLFSKQKRFFKTLRMISIQDFVANSKLELVYSVLL